MIYSNTNTDDLHLIFHLIVGAKKNLFFPHKEDSSALVKKIVIGLTIHLNLKQILVEQQLFDAGETITYYVKY